MSMTLDDLQKGVADGSIQLIDAVTELAWRLNANDPESLKMGWPLVTCVETAIERFSAQGTTVDGMGITEAVRKRLIGEDRETGAILVVQDGLPSLFRVFAWPGAGSITAEKSHTGLSGRFRNGSVNWRAIGSVHPGFAEQYAKALRVAAEIASQTVEETVEG